MKTSARLCAIFVALVSLAVAQRPSSIFGEVAPVLSVEQLKSVALPNTFIESVALDPTGSIVQVVAIVSHPPARDRVKVWVALPVKNWNGRFMGSGGGGFSGGNPGGPRNFAAQGFAAASTDTGHEGGSGAFALSASGRLNWPEIRANAYLGIHAMAVTGKALAQAFYGRAPRWSYFTGSSTGGRQGLMAAQRFPADFDGIFSGCPAINWAHMVPGTFWPQVVMTEAKHFVSKAKLDAATAAAIAAHDADDGVRDGIIDDPVRATWDPRALVGTKVGAETFTEADAAVVRQIWEGPRGVGGRALWHGVTRGSNLFALAGTEGEPLRGKPFGVSHEWFKFFLIQNPQWDATTITRGEFELLMDQSVELFGPLFSADNPDLTAFRDRGGKVIITHGLSDQLIPPQGTTDYYGRVQQRMGGAEATAKFARLFLVPGVDHGFRGAAPSPVGTQAALLRWVEEGVAPDRLMAEQRDAAGKIVRTRPLFPHPQYAKYSGSGSADDAANFAAATRAR